MKDKITQICIDKTSSILSAIKQMDIVKHKLLIVTENNNYYYSMLSIGDIQRAIIKGVDMSTSISEILRPNVNVAFDDEDKSILKERVLKRQMEFLPLINHNNEIIEVIFWNELTSRRPERSRSNLGLPVVIMAGGKGTRLRPLTNVLPKPLIPIGEQTMMEDIMDRFLDCGCNEFYVSVNYKADTIKRYFDNLGKPQYDIHYFQEDKPLGTAGSISLLKGMINSTFFVSNCDSILDEDYSEILKYHRDNENELTVIAVIKNMSVPYGTLETKEDGLLAEIKEKPEFTFKINTGFYVLEPHLIDEIPEDEFYHITFLIDKLIKEDRRVGVYPINEGSWIDIGNWSEYIKYINQ